MSWGRNDREEIQRTVAAYFKVQPDQITSMRWQRDRCDVEYIDFTMPDEYGWGGGHHMDMRGSVTKFELTLFAINNPQPTPPKAMPARPNTVSPDRY
jgi:hypothetical protein